MRRLFNEYEAFTPEGNELSDRAESFLRPLLIEYCGSGVSMRDAEYILHSTVSAITAEIVLKSAVAKRKAERRVMPQVNPTEIPESGKGGAL